MGIIALVVLVILIIYIRDKNEDFTSRIDNVRSMISDVSYHTEATVSKLEEQESNNSKKTNEVTSAMQDKINVLYERLNNAEKNFQTLASTLRELKEDNDRFKKELEFFTEIKSDSTKLNVTENEEQRNALLERALSQIESGYKNGIGDSNSLDNVVISSEAHDVSAKHSLQINSISSNDTFPVLDAEQRLAFDHIVAGENLFITGKAGTGKSFLLSLFVKGNKDKKVILLAPTGVAAINIGGVTIHSAFGYNNLEKCSIESICDGNILLKSEKIAVLKKVDAIFIDEISMVRADIFEKMDMIMRKINNNDLPFGGKQVVLFGDLFQLPPVVKRDEIKYLKNIFGGIHFFNSDAYKNAKFKFIELTINHRQKEDRRFFDILNKIRSGEIDDETLSLLNNRCQYDSKELEHGRIIRLFPKKEKAESVNQEELGKIKSKEYVYEAEVIYVKPNITAAINDGSFPITKTLHLKNGALIMMVTNDVNRRWVNGTLGIISGLKDDSVKVTINGVEYEVTEHEFEIQEAIYKNGQISYETVLKVQQIPVVLAYATTIHKSQGMTYQKIACDITDCFSPGQVYVALSRCTSLNGLYMLKPATQNILKVDPCVEEFYLSNKK